MPNLSYSLHIGINNIDPVHYQGWNGTLYCCENDAMFFQSVATKAGFNESRILLSSDSGNLPTSQNLSTFLTKASAELSEGDMLLITYSGHGGVVQDLNFDEDDFQDETWCLYDRQFLDDELFKHFSKFKPGVRIFIISDSCHSGSVAKVFSSDKDKKVLSELDEIYNKLNLVTRDAPRKYIFPTYMANKSLYDPIMKQPIVRSDDIDASVLLFAACQDDEKAAEWDGFGLFTSTIKKILETNKELSSYNEFFLKVKREMPGIQNPNLYAYGANYSLFKNEKPFQVAGNLKSFSFFNPARNFCTPAHDDEQLIIEIAGQTGEPGTDDSMKLMAIDPAQGSYTNGQTVYLLKPTEKENGSHSWDYAYKEYFTLKNSEKPVVFVEPDVKNKYLKETPLSKDATTDNNYLSNWPKPADGLGPLEFIWHLDDQHSQLKKAREKVLDRISKWSEEEKQKYGSVIRIAHIDTGYLPDHPSTPKNILKNEGISFVKDEGENKAIDLPRTGTLFEQDGHGCATMALLAGTNITNENSYSLFEGEFGAIPFAEVLPIRICDTVINLFNANDIASAIDYAIDHGCDVITMSMAGYPTRRVARAVNRAYEKGVVLVTASGNNWKGGVMSLTPKAVMYPARFDRVIAACGVCYNEEPYDLEANSWLRFRSEGSENMQGNWGPERCMGTALAAYTPNLAWAVNTNSKYKFSKAGGGTSSATPQIAAAAALWIAYNRKALIDKGYAGTWKQAEAVRQALFTSGAKTYPGYRKYYGNGSLKANDALEHSEEILNAELLPAKEAEIKFLGLISFVNLWFKGLDEEPDPSISTITNNADDTLKEMVALEIAQVMYKDPELFAYTEMLNLEEHDSFFENPAARDIFVKKLKNSKYASDTLKVLLK